MAEPRAASEATASGIREDPRAGGLGDPPGTRTRTETEPGKTAPGAIAGGAWSSWRERCPPGYRRDAVPADDPARRDVAAAVAPAPRYVPSRDDAKRARTDADANANANAEANPDENANANPDAHRADPEADPSTSAGYGVAVAASEEWARALLDAAETRAARRKRRGSSRRDDPRPASRDDPARPPPTHAASPASSRAAVRAAARAVLADPVALAALARRHLACPVARLDDDNDDDDDDPTASLRGPDPELFFPPARRVHEDAETQTQTQTEAETEAAASEKTDERAGSSVPRLVATPLPAPTAVVGYQRDWLRVASPALALWDKAPFEPLGGRTRDREYFVAAPRALADAAAETVAETSAAYEILGLGSHDAATAAAAAANPAAGPRRGDVRAAVFEGETLDDAVDAAAKAIAERRRRGVGEVVVYLATDSNDADATLAAELSAEARIAAIVGARAARDVRATAIPRRALGRASMRPEHARGLAFAAYARAAAEPTDDVDEDKVEVDAKEATGGRARVVAADVTGASRRARPVRGCSDRGGADDRGADRGASAAAATADDSDRDSDSDSDSGGWRLPAHAPLCALYWRQDDAPRAEESRAPPPPLPAPVPNRLARGLGRASSFAVASNVSASASASASAAVSLSLSRGGSPAPASPGGPAAVTGHTSRASRLAPPPPATTREEKDAEDAARRRERTAPGLHCCYVVSERRRGARWVAAAWTDTRGEAFGMEARAFPSPFPSDGDGDDATFERRVARWLTRRCALFAEALARAAGGGGGADADADADGDGRRKGTTSDAAGASSDEAAAARRVARARAFFGDDPSSSAKRTVANGAPHPAAADPADPAAADPADPADPAAAAPDPEYRRVAVLRLGAASSAASRALEEAARAVVDADRLAEMLVGEMHAGTNLRLSPDAEDAAIPGETFAVVSDAAEGVAAAARAPSQRHLGESRGDGGAVAAVTVRVSAVCGPGHGPEQTRDGDATPRTYAAVDLARRYARLSALAEATTRPRSTRAPPTPPHADAAASLADALARVERFAADEETIDER